MMTILLFTEIMTEPFIIIPFFLGLGLIIGWFVFNNRKEINRVELETLNEQLTHAEVDKENLTSELEKLNMLVKKTVNSIIIADKYGKIEWVNEGFTRNTGYSLEEVKDTYGEILRHGEKTELANPQLFKELQKGDSVFRYERLNYKKDGSEMYVLTNITPITDNDGKIAKIMAIDSDITNQKKFEDKLRTAKERAERSESIKEQFLMNMSHEIRTPMNAIIGMSQLLHKTKLDEKQENYVRSIRSAGENLLTIINDILDFSKIEAGKVEIDETEFGLRNLVNNLANTVRFRINEKNIDLKIEIDENVPNHLTGDPVRLNQILLNLIGNAIKFTHEGHVKLKVSIKSVNKKMVTIHFMVQDTGIGIPQDKLETIFDSFTQASADTTRKYGGTGLGLSITKKLITMLNGKIWIESEVSVGSEFHFVLKYKYDEKAFIENRGGIKAAIFPEDLKSVNILLAEDNDFNQIVAVDTIEAFNPAFKVDVAENGKIALDKLSQNHYDLILMDIQMPEMDGFETTEAIRSLDSDKSKTPIIAMTAHAMAQDAEKCLKAGMNDYISKPFNPNLLLDKILQNIRKDTSDIKITTPKAMEVEEITEEVNSSTTPQVTNLSFINEFAKGDQEKVKKYIGIYLKHVPQQMEMLRQEIEAHNYKKAGTIAHGLKPQMTYMGMPQMHDAMKYIEDTGKIKEVNYESLWENFSVTDQTVQRSIKELSNFINK